MCKVTRLNVSFGFLLVMATLAAAGMLAAQDTRAGIRGRVTDQAGGIIPGVEVAARNLDTGVSLSGATGDTGDYRLDYLIPGRYELSTSLPGFKTFKRVIELRTGDRLTIDFSLEIGEVTDEIVVGAETPLLQASNADLSQIIDKSRIDTLPHAQGNTTWLVTMAAGAAAPGNTFFFKFDEPAFTQAADTSFHGTRAGFAGFSLDGVNNSLGYTGGSTVNVQPPTEAVQEMKVSHAYDAGQGQHNGTTVELNLRTGTNAFHGALYGFFRNSSLNAGGFFDNRAGLAKPDSTYRRIGGSVFGPIRRDKTFFAFTYEDTFQRTTELYGSRTVPSADMLKGDFSKLLALGPQYQIFDPASTKPTGTGFFTRDPFPNNIIPSQRIHPISKKLMEFWPAPNQPGGADGTSNFQPSTPSPTEWYQTVSRIDHNFSAGHRLFGHFSNIHSQGQWRDYYGNLATGFWENIRRQSFGLDDVLVINPNWLLNFRYGFTRAYDPRLHKSHKASPGGSFDITTLGLSPSLIPLLNLDLTSLPHILIQGFSGIHDETRNFLDTTYSHSAEAQTDLTRGSHTLKLGFAVRSIYVNRANNTWVMPRYEFGCSFMNGPLNTAPCAQGQGFAAFLLGQPSGGFINRAANFAGNNAYYSLFTQNSWRASSDLTLNFGLRWEYWSPVTERFNRSVRNFAFGASSPIEAAARAAYAQNPIAEIPVDQFRLRGGYTFAGVGGEPRALYDSPKNILAPRLGLAYRLSDETVIRAGYGIFHVPMGITGEGIYQPHQAGFARTTELIASLDNGQSYIADIVNPFPGGILEPLGSAGGLATDMGFAASFFNAAGLKAPYNQRWSLSVQRMLPLDTLLELGYVGTRGTGLVLSRNLNFLPEQYLSRKTTRDEAVISALNRAVPNPMRGLIRGSGLNAPTIRVSQLLTPYPHFTGVTLRQSNQGYSWYHGLEGRLEKRMKSGYSYSVVYNWSKAREAMTFLNLSDPVPYETLAGFDRTQVLKFSAIWELPFGRGRRFGGDLSPGLSRLVGGWQISSLWQLQGGFPMTFGNVFVEPGFNPKNLDLPKDQRTVNRWFNTEAGFVRNPAQQPAFNLRTFPLNFSNLRTDSINFWDISLVKTTAIGESSSIQFQAQFLNAFNHPSFGPAVTNPASGSFGRVSEEVTWPRRIMFGLKFSF